MDTDLRPATRRLAYVHVPRSFSWMSILAAARGICELIWVIEAADPEMAAIRRLLERSGTVVDRHGGSAADVAAALGVHRPDGILALHDQQLGFAAELAQSLGLRFHRPPVARALSDKVAQRAALAAGGVPIPGVWPVPDHPVAADDPFWSQVRFPAILKPRRGEASRDTVRVDSAEALERELKTVTTRGGGSDLVVEGYIPDRPEDLGRPFAGYVSVESITAPDGIHHVAITGRFPPAPPLRESGFFMPAALSGEEAAAVREAAEAAVRAVGIEVGASHTEVKLTPDGPRVIEVNGRIGGGISELMRDLCGYDLLAQALRVALGDAPEPVPTAPDGRVAFLFYVQAPVGMREIRAVDGIEALSGHPAVSEVILNRPPGSRVDWREGNHGHVLSVRGTRDGHATLAQFAEELPLIVAIR